MLAGAPARQVAAREAERDRGALAAVELDLLESLELLRRFTGRRWEADVELGDLGAGPRTGVGHATRTLTIAPRAATVR